mmetsp:Transcript_32687/g.77402  ORF Transcript_32687/g.77402 Transcript_32687/m.77402 type:complete len:228 (-) Transcript_32687:79-762(-)
MSYPGGKSPSGSIAGTRKRSFPTLLSNLKSSSSSISSLWQLFSNLRSPLVKTGRPQRHSRSNDPLKTPFVNRLSSAPPYIVSSLILTSIARKSSLTFFASASLTTYDSASTIHCGCMNTRPSAIPPSPPACSRMAPASCRKRNAASSSLSPISHLAAADRNACTCATGFAQSSRSDRVFAAQVSLRALAASLRPSSAYWTTSRSHAVRGAWSVGEAPPPPAKCITIP